MAASDAADMHEQFALIRRQFIAGLARRLQEMAQASTPSELHAVLHRLAGAAGSFGFEALSQQARQTMSAVEAQDVDLQKQCLAALTAAMQALLAESGSNDTIS